jgi:RNA polymerase sigma factor (sigma-70 family)
MTPDKLAVFQAARPMLLGLAYRMLGEAAEAEDVVQDAYLRWERADSVDAPEAWLTRVVANLCLNRLTSARVRREQYVGPWLPEPILVTDDFGPLETVEQRDSLSLGMLVVLERLTPPERLAFVLREAFAYSHAEIASVLQSDEAHARQLYRRARTHIAESRKRFTPAPSETKRIVEGFFSASVDGDVATLEKLLAEDVTVWFDGGGKVGRTWQPVVGRAAVVAYLIRWTPVMERARITFAEVNGEPAVVVHEADRLWGVMVLELADDQVTGVRTIANPDKLGFAAKQLA